MSLLIETQILPGSYFLQESETDRNADTEYGAIDEQVLYKLLTSVCTRSFDDLPEELPLFNEAMDQVETLARERNLGAIVRCKRIDERASFNYQIDVWERVSEEAYKNKLIRILSDQWTEEVGISGCEGYVRSIYKGKLQVPLPDRAANPYELLPSQVELV